MRIGTGRGAVCGEPGWGSGPGQGGVQGTGKGTGPRQSEGNRNGDRDRDRDRGQGNRDRSRGEIVPPYKRFQVVLCPTPIPPAQAHLATIKSTKPGIA
ncbi:hypothetical protein WISP_145958 [Willisornis vidua]|uniref:Uncharacterized protein n=1 Tax=Willisornis vidua TaxID=1566151 RepID=A0ABQ9CKT8_9PASS|nr:hypothetical protein WISP_145958 [Willisornis vidua]